MQLVQKVILNPEGQEFQQSFFCARNRHWSDQCVLEATVTAEKSPQFLPSFWLAMNN